MQRRAKSPTRSREPVQPMDEDDQERLVANLRWQLQQKDAQMQRYLAIGVLSLQLVLLVRAFMRPLSLQSLLWHLGPNLVFLQYAAQLPLPFVGLLAAYYVARYIFYDHNDDIDHLLATAATLVVVGLVQMLQSDQRATQQHLHELETAKYRYKSL